jgi:thymidylate synthase/dihydrofolate reductase
MLPRVSLVVAFDNRNGIGHAGKIPWDFPLDRTFFKDVTDRGKGLTAAVIMGRTTFDGLPAPLKNRVNLVLTSRPMEHEALSLLDGPVSPGVYSANAAEMLLVIAGLNSLGVPVYVAGGAAVYNWAAESCRVEDIYYTAIDAEYAADTFFKWPKQIAFNPAANIRKFIVGGADLVFANCSPRPNHWEMQYLDSLYKIMTTGSDNTGRNGMTRSLFEETMRFDLGAAFPLLTTKRVFFRAVFEELMMFLRGQTNTLALEDKGIGIWKKNTSSEFIASRGLALPQGEMGPMYGYNLRHFGRAFGSAEGGFDQFYSCLDTLLRDPFGRRAMMTTFDPSVVDQGVLPPCHGISIVFGCRQIDGAVSLSCSMTQRSADMFCGVPFNIASYALLVHLMCSILSSEGPRRFVPGELVMHFVDAHIYEAHFDLCRRQSLRIPQGNPRVAIPSITRTFMKPDGVPLEFADVELSGYTPHYAMPAEMQ